MFYVRVRGRLYGAPHADLAAAKKAAGGFLLDRRTEKRAEIVPVAPGVIGGVGPPVATVRKLRTGAISITDAIV